MGITEALKLGPIGFVLAPLIEAAGAVQIGVIASQKPPSKAQDGIDFIPEDNQTFLTSRGERIVGERLNRDLTDFLQQERGRTGSANGSNMIFNFNITGQIGDSDETASAVANAATNAFEFLNISRGGQIA